MEEGGSVSYALSGLARERRAAVGIFMINKEGGTGGDAAGRDGRLAGETTTRYATAIMTN